MNTVVVCRLLRASRRRIWSVMSAMQQRPVMHHLLQSKSSSNSSIKEGLLMADTTISRLTIC